MTGTETKPAPDSIPETMTSRIINAPWKVFNELQRLLVYPWARLLFALNGVAWGRGWKLYGVPILQKHRQSTMIIGPGFSLRSTQVSNPLGPNHPVLLCAWQKDSHLEIGENFAMSGGTLCAVNSIKIGNRVAIGANTTVVDSDFHPIDPALRRTHPNDGITAPVIIEDDVFIGMNCLILKGVTIGQGSVIGAGSVVSRSIPAGVIAAGNPAKVLRELKTIPLD